MLIDGVSSGSTVTCAANDTIIVRSVSTTQFKLSRIKYDGTAQVNPVATATVSGLVPTPPNNTTTFLRGDATFASATPAASSVAQGILKTTTAAQSFASFNIGNTIQVTLTGGTYSWWTAHLGVGPGRFGFGSSVAGAQLGVVTFENDGTQNGTTLYVDERYVQASPPYTHGPLFVFLMLNRNGEIVRSSVAADPPWAYHGPTDITPQYYIGNKGFRKQVCYDGLTITEILKSENKAMICELLRGGLQKTEEDREITLSYKDSDMDLEPHPWCKSPSVENCTVVMMDGDAPVMQYLADIHSQTDAAEIGKLLPYLHIDNVHIAAKKSPKGVLLVSARLK